MKQLSLLPEVPETEILQAAKVEQLSLLKGSDYLGRKGSSPPPKQALTTSKCWYQGKCGEIVKRFSEDFDGMKLKFCRVKFDDGTFKEVLENHLTIL